MLHCGNRAIQYFQTLILLKNNITCHPHCFNFGHFTFLICFLGIPPASLQRHTKSPECLIRYVLFSIRYLGYFLLGRLRHKKIDVAVNWKSASFFSSCSFTHSVADQMERHSQKKLDFITEKQLKTKGTHTKLMSMSDTNTPAKYNRSLRSWRVPLPAHITYRGLFSLFFWLCGKN